MLELLGTLMGGTDRVKIMRLFLANPDNAFTEADVRSRSQLRAPMAKRELKILMKIKFIKPSSFWRGEDKDKQRMKGFRLNADFPLLRSIKNLLFNTEPFTRAQIIEMFKGSGRIKLIIVSGVFTRSEERRMDILIVGDSLRKRTVESAVKKMEAEIGQELNYALFETSEYVYRVDMYDKLVRDVLDYPHEVIVDKLSL